MAFTTFINVADLVQRLNDPDWAVIDCRFSLDDTELGRRAYQQAHIPGAVYAHLDEHLSGPVIPGQTSRHPFPAVEPLTQALSNFGIDDRVQVIAYDDNNGGIAARIWGLLRWMGHQNVALLNGGFDEWQRQGHPVRGGQETRPTRQFTPHPQPDRLATAGDIMAMRNDNSRLFDSRAIERYRGEEEELDPVAGHIPGAISAHYYLVFDENGLIHSREHLKAHYQALLGDIPAEQAVFYCGSGVTANFNIVALQHAGLGQARIYPGSWSEWITDPTRPVATK